MYKVKFFTGYFIIDNLIFKDQAASAKLELLLQDSNPYQVISDLNGSFRFAINSESKTYFGIDHFGGYSLFYRDLPNFELLLAPSKEGKLSKLSDENILCLLASGFCYGDKTIYSDIKECLPGNLYTYDSIQKNITRQEWFSIDLQSSKVRDKSDLSDIFLSLIPKNFSTSILALTGGIDSRLILSLFRKNKTSFSSLTYGSQDNPDTKIVNQIADQSQIKHQMFYFDRMNLAPYFTGSKLKNFLDSGFLARSLPFESDWLVSNSLKGSTQWLTTGFTSFWLRPPYQDSLPIKNQEQLINKIIHSQCNQSLISSPKFKDILLANIKSSMSHFKDQAYDSNYDRWNIENRQHKYIINTSNNYRFNNIEVFMPLFDRRIMEFLNNTCRQQRAEQKIFMEAIISNIFTGNESYLKDIPSTNPKFTNQLLQRKVKASKWKNRLLKLDKNNLNRIFRRPNTSMYQIIQSVLLQSPDYLSKNIEDAFPKINSTISLLYDLNLTNSANHLKWLKKKKVVQLNLLGIEIIAFLVENFHYLARA